MHSTSLVAQALQAHGFALEEHEGHASFFRGEPGGAREHLIADCPEVRPPTSLHEPVVHVADDGTETRYTSLAAFLATL
jgi:hypothetical protein